MPARNPPTDIANALPEDVPTLQQRLQASQSECELLKLMVAKLRLQLARRARAEFGASSERFGPAQGTLIEAALLDGLERPAAKVTPAANTPEIYRSLPAHLPREQQEHRPQTAAGHHDALGQPCGCNVCGGRLRQIGADVSEQLEYVPAHFKVIRHVRPKLACTKCEAIFQAAAPSRPIARGVAGPGLLAQVIVAKFCDHLPLYRQSRIYAAAVWNSAAPLWPDGWNSPLL